MRPVGAPLQEKTTASATAQVACSRIFAAADGVGPGAGDELARHLAASRPDAPNALSRTHMRFYPLCMGALQRGCSERARYLIPSAAEHRNACVQSTTFLGVELRHEGRADAIDPEHAGQRKRHRAATIGRL